MNVMVDSDTTQMITRIIQLGQSLMASYPFRAMGDSRRDSRDLVEVVLRGNQVAQNHVGSGRSSESKRT